MKNKQSIIYYFIFALVITISIICVWLSNDLIINVFSTVSTIFGVIGLLYSFHLDRNISEASFLLQLHQTFKNNEKIQKLSQKLESVFLEIPTTIDENDRNNIVEYLTFFEMIGSMEERGVISIASFDSLFGYDFFIAVDNVYVKQIELDSYSEYYKQTHRLMKKWRRYRKKHKLVIPLEHIYAAEK